MAKTNGVQKRSQGGRGARRAVGHCHRAGWHSLGARSRYRLAAAAPRPERHAAALGRRFADPRGLLAQGSCRRSPGSPGRISLFSLALWHNRCDPFPPSQAVAASSRKELDGRSGDVFVRPGVNPGIVRSAALLAPTAAASVVSDVKSTTETSGTHPRPAALIYTVWPLATASTTSRSAHYGDGEQWHAIYAANVGVRQTDGRALDGTNWIYPGWKLTLPDVAIPATAPVMELARPGNPDCCRRAHQRLGGHYPCRRAWGQLVGDR